MRNAVKVLVLLIAASAALMAQISQFTVYTDVSGATFRVDGQEYNSKTVFLWANGSKHTLELLGTSYAPDGILQYSCGTWSDNADLLIPSGSLVQVVTADSRITSFKGSCTVSGYRVDLNFYGDAVTPSLATPNNCGAPGIPTSGQTGVGLVQVANALTSGCFYRSTYFYATGKMTLNAFPYPGYVFTGWSPAGESSTAYLTTFDVTRHLQLTARFEPARRVEFRTEPAGLKVAIDRTIVATPSATPCPAEQLLPVGPANLNLTVAGTYGQMCTGDFDFAFGSQHLASAPTPQTDANGANWVFDSWQGGGGQNTVYTAPVSTGVDHWLAKFVPGVRVIVTTHPFGLKVGVDGRNTWPSYSFVWAAGSTHNLAAPLEQTDSAGRRWVFTGWRQGGEATQDYVVPSEAPGVLVASYELLGRLNLGGSMSGVAVQVDDTTCKLPCSIDRPAGTVVKLTVPATIAISEGYRADFTGWGDSMETTRTVTLTSDVISLSANYQYLYKLTITSDPAGAGTYHLDPDSSDGFYTYNTPVSLKVEAKNGYKFRRWAGDVTGSLAGTFVLMNGIHNVQALFDKVPYVAPSGVRNAAGETPDAVVSPGSRIAITGASMTEQYVAGPSNPLAQTIAGIYVILDGRILPLVSVAPDQVVALLPSDLKAGDYTLKVYFPAQPAATATFTVVRNAPGLFSSYDEAGTPFAMAWHEDGSTIKPDSPAKKSETISLLGTGFGPYDQPWLDGFAIPVKPQMSLVDAVAVLAGETAVTPSWSGAAPGMIGITQVRFRLPADAASGKVPIKARVNERDSNTVDLPVE